jgi:hypothetical protein
MKHIKLFESFDGVNESDNKAKTVKFDGFDCLVHYGRYEKNDRTYMILIDKDNGELVADATINMPEIDVPEGSVLVRNEKDMIEALVRAGIVSKPSGWVDEPEDKYAAICKLLVKEGPASPDFVSLGEGNITAGTVSDMYDKYGEEYPYAAAAVAYFIFGEKDNIVDRAIKGVYGRNTEAEESGLSAYMLDYEYGWEDYMEDIDNFIRNYPTRNGKIEDHY